MNRIRTKERLTFLLTLIPALLLLIAASATIAQDTVPDSIPPAAGDTVGTLAGVEVRTSVNRAEIFIGDQVTYTLTIIHDSTIELVPPPLGANLGAFQVLDYETDRITRLPDGRVQNENRFVISTFTTGDYAVPPMPIVALMPDSSRKVLLSEAVPIKVESILAGDDSLMDIKPLAGVLGPEAFEKDRTWYYIGGGAAALVLLAVLLWVLLRRRRKPSARPIDLRPSWEIASERLALLMHRDLIAEARFKEYYIELSEILRWFLGRVYEKNVLDWTTGEFLAAFREIELPHSLYHGVEAFMAHADLVKFARYEPEVAQTKYDFEFVHAAIDRVRQDIYRRRQMEVVTPNGGPKQPAATVGGGTHES